MLHKNQKGAVAVEFAVILPLLVLLVFGMIEFGMLFYDKQVITNASREGARYGITLTDLSDEELTNKMTSIISEYCIYEDNEGHSKSKLINLNGSNYLDVNKINITPPDSNNNLTVEVSFEYNFLFEKIIGLGSGTTVTARTVMRMEPTTS